MARNDTQANEARSVGLVPVRGAGADSWQTLISVVVASALLVAIVLSALTLVESVFSGPAFSGATQQASKNSESVRESLRIPARY